MNDILSKPVVPLEQDIVDTQETTDVTEIKKGRRFFPVQEPDNVREMYEYYEGLGPKRTLYKVGVHFGKSHSTIAALSRRYGWTDRARAFDKSQDPVKVIAKDLIDKSRQKLVDIVGEITDTLHEIMFIAKACKRGVATPESDEKLRRLQKALGLWGFEWKSPRDFKVLIETLKQIIDFNEEVKSRTTKATQINAEKFELHIKD